jgi:hypothetical protein
MNAEISIKMVNAGTNEQGWTAILRVNDKEVYPYGFGHTPTAALECLIGSFVNKSIDELMKRGDE